MSLRKLAAAAAVLSASMSLATPAQAGVDAWIGEIVAYGNNFCPRGWAETSGQLLAISQNQALFSLLGTTYGGNGTTTFALPDLRGRAAISQGSGSLGTYSEGQMGGAESFTVTLANMPSHTHTATLRAVAAAGTTNDPNDNSVATAPTGVTMYSTVDPTNNMNAGDVVLTPTGAGTPVSATSPSLTMRYCIALTGVFPSRN